MSTEQLTEEDKKEIDALSHEEMCSIWRFGTSNQKWLDGRHPAAKYFSDRLFKHFGGFTSEISKRIGW
ncbi:MAG: hypothetical protein M0R46_15210 [Candidatus Muirbacterium halophilum]|nr:hypothetical protein [Candidatus Muirbacterium halophilum]